MTFPWSVLFAGLEFQKRARERHEDDERRRLKPKTADKPRTAPEAGPKSTDDLDGLVQ